MTNEERDLITSFVARVGGAPAAGVPGAGQGAVAPLPPVDRDADALLADLFSRYPEARYRITQLAYVQEQALVQAQNRLQQLQWQLQQAQQQAQQAAAQPEAPSSPWGTAAGAAAGAAAAGSSRGIFGNLFGSRPSAPPPPPQPPQYAAPPPQYAPQYAPPPPSYPPGYNPGMLQQQGPGFFGSALRTAAGVAGGVLAADALMSLFSPHQGIAGGLGGGFGGGGLGGGFGGPGVVENVTINNPGANPWGGTDPMDAGGALKDGSDSKFDAPPTVDQSAWSPAPQDQGGGGWQDAQSNQGGTDQGGGWQDAPPDDSSGGGWDDASSDSGGGNDDWT
jgi:uncharacterized protein